MMKKIFRVFPVVLLAFVILGGCAYAELTASGDSYELGDSVEVVFTVPNGLRAVGAITVQAGYDSDALSLVSAECAGLQSGSVQLTALSTALPADGRFGASWLDVSCNITVPEGCELLRLVFEAVGVCESTEISGSFSFRGIADPENADSTGDDDLTAASGAAGAPVSLEITPVTVKSIAIAELHEAVDISGQCALTAQVLPENAANKALRWTVTDGAARADIDPSTGTVTPKGLGSVTVRATAADGSGIYDEISFEITGYYVRPAQTAAEVFSRGSVQLGAAAEPDRGAGLVWSLLGELDGEGNIVNADSVGEYASVSAAGKFTAKPVTEAHTVVVSVGSDEAEETARAVPATVYVTVVPPTLSVTLLDEAGAALNGKTLLFDAAKPGNVLKVRPVAVPDGAYQSVKWSGISALSPLVISESADEDGFYSLTYRDGAKPASVRLTATATDGTRKSAYFTVNVVRLAQSIELEAGTEFLASGKSFAFKVRDADTGAYLRSGITWSVSEIPDGVDAESSAVIATVDKTGRLTAKAVNRPRRVRLTAALTGSDALEDSCEVTIYPLATAMNICIGEETVTGRTVPVNLSAVSSVDLDAAVSPSGAYMGATGQDVTWISSSRLAPVSEDGVVDLSALTGKTTVTVTAKAKDGSGRACIVKLMAGRLVSDVGITGPDELRTGEKIRLAAEVNGDAAIKTVTWKSGNSAAALVTATGEVRAGTVYRDTVVSITATARDGSGASAEKLITVKPKESQLLISFDGRNITKDTLSLDAADCGETIALTASAEPDETVTWRSSNPKIVELQPDGSARLLRSGSVTVTASAVKGRVSRTATVVIRISKLVSTLGITGPDSVASGKSIRLTAGFGGESPAIKTVKWTVDRAALAKISSSGTLTAAAGLRRAVDVTVTASAADGSGVSACYTVRVTPACTGVDIFDSLGGLVNGAVLTVDVNGADTLLFSAAAYPLGEGGARQSVTWKSSSSAIAAVDQNGTVTVARDRSGALKTGTVTISATAADGSGKKAEFKLRLVRGVTGVELIRPAANLAPDGENAVLAVGRTLALKADVSEKSATNRKLIWSVSGDSAYATVTQTGVVRALSATSPKTVTVRAEAADGSGEYDEMKVFIYPAPRTITAAGGIRQTARVGEQKQLELSVVPAFAYGESFSWKTSSARIATVDENGLVTFTGKGTVVITASARDLSGKTAKVTFTVTA